MITIGIDSGLKGGVAYMHDGGIYHAHNLYPISDMIEEIHSLILQHGRGDVRVVIEEPPAYVKPIPSHTTYKMGVSYGECKGIAQGSRIQCITVDPKTWQKGLKGLKGLEGPARKRMLKDHAFRLYPDLKPTLQTADAILLLHQTKHTI